mgnify:CR=1 FL=1
MIAARRAGEGVVSVSPDLNRTLVKVRLGEDGALFHGE